MSEYAERIASLLMLIGESVEIFYEPRNEGAQWYVGLADPHGKALPLHEHFADLAEGLTWLHVQKRQGFT